MRSCHPFFLRSSPKEFLFSADTYKWETKRKEERLMGMKVKSNETLYGEKGRSLAVRCESEDSEEEKKVPEKAGITL